jgi:hypothetical protein
MTNRMFIFALGIASVIYIQGCSSYKAMNQPDRKDLTTILAIGSDRDLVRAELGQPVSFGKDGEGNEYEVYSFVDGYHTATKASRAVFHFAADVFTLGLWEIVGNPIEGAYKGDKMVMRVTYKNARVSKVENLTPPPPDNSTVQSEPAK